MAFVISFFDFGIDSRKKDFVEPDGPFCLTGLYQPLQSLMHSVQVIDESGHLIPPDKPSRHQFMPDVSDQRVFYALAHFLQSTPLWSGLLFRLLDFQPVGTDLLKDRRGFMFQFAKVQPD